MATESKICPSCQEKNNPTFKKCWKCKLDFETGELPMQQPITAAGNDNSKKPLNYFWFVGGFFLIHCVLKAFRYLSFGEGGGVDFFPAVFGLLVMAFMNGSIAWAIYFGIREVSMRKKSPSS